jgi:predicted amidohydrolase YtcJ
MTMQAESVAITGRVVSMAGAVDAEAVLIINGRIASVGSRSILREAEAAGVPVHDVGGRVVLPGFVDPHIHLEHLATGRARGVDCRVPGCQTIGDVLDRLSDSLDDVGESGWLIGYGNLFFDQKLADRRLPTRAELDSVSSTVPILLHCGGHVSVLNSRALEVAKVERFLQGAAGLWGSPVVELDHQGRPTGVVGEIDHSLPLPPPDAEMLRKSLVSTYLELFTTYGVTTFGEMVESVESVDLLDDLIGTGQIPARGGLYAMAPSMLPLEEAAAWAGSYESGAGSEWLTAPGVKTFADGGYSARNAATRTPYVDEHSLRPGSMGRLNLTHPRLVAAIRSTRDNGVQLAVHANGERAQDEVIDAVLSVGATYDGPWVRIEHAGNVMTTRSSLAGWRRANILPVLQPQFLYNFIGDFLPVVLGGGGTKGRLPLRTLLEEGIMPAASSDVGLGAEDELSNPLFSVWSCVERKSFFGRTIEPDERLTVSEALRLHTIEAARAMGRDHDLGSLEPGKLGDVVVLDRDPRSVPAHEIRDVRVDAVYVGGRRVHERVDG